MSDVFDRDAARDVLAAKYGPNAPDAQVLDALEACVRPAPQQTIDRDTLVQAMANALAAHVSSDWVMKLPNSLADAALALLRPVDGVTLTRDEARIAATALAHQAMHHPGGVPHDWGVPYLNLAERLVFAAS